MKSNTKRERVPQACLLIVNSTELPAARDGLCLTRVFDFAFGARRPSDECNTRLQHPIVCIVDELGNPELPRKTVAAAARQQSLAGRIKRRKRSTSLLGKKKEEKGYSRKFYLSGVLRDDDNRVATRLVDARHTTTCA